MHNKKQVENQKHPSVSVAIVTYNEEDNIGQCLERLCRQDYEGKVEILIVDGNSQDRTVEIVKEFQLKVKTIKLINNPERTIASNRMIAVHEALSALIAFTDADCLVPETWLTILVDNFIKQRELDEQTAAVGGSNIPPDAGTTFHLALGIMLDSFLGSLGSVQGKFFSTITKVRSLACLNILYDRSKVLSVGSFDPAMRNMAEDADLNSRLRKNNFSLYFIPDSYVVHKYRPGLGSWFVNMYEYGKGRAFLMKRNRTAFHIVYLLPIFFILSFLLSAFGFIAEIFFLPFLYFPLILIYAFHLTRKTQEMRLTLQVFLNFIVTHFAFSLGEIFGFLGARPK